MEILIAQFFKITGDVQHARMLAIMLFALAIFIASICLFVIFLSSDRKIHRRIKSLSDSEVLRTASINVGEIRRDQPDKTTDALDKFLTPKDTKERAEKRQLLGYAGFHGRGALSSFYAIKVLGAVIGLMAVMAYVSLKPETSLSDSVTYALLALGIGMMLPNIILSKLVKKRQSVLKSSFPDALDLLVVCVEAGMGLDAALQKTTNSLALSAPELSDELALVNVSLRVGMPRVQALRNMVVRTGLVEVKGLLAVIEQSARYGTGVADSLRVYAKEFRAKRRQEMEEAAAKVSTKLIFPLIICIWPSFFIVALGPSFMTIMEALST